MITFKLGKNIPFLFLNKIFKRSITTCSDIKELIEVSDKMIHSDIKGVKIWKDFITCDIENKFVNEIDKKLSRVSYQEGHWDNAIVGYRELEIQDRVWSEDILSVINSLKLTAFKTTDKCLSSTHVLDLSATGFIKAHVDSVKFCGRAIAGVSLLSSSVMKFVNEKDENMWFKIVLPRRSLYLMEGDARYKFTHEILKDEESICNGVHIKKGRRISVLNRTQIEQRYMPEDIFKPTVFSLD